MKKKFLILLSFAIALGLLEAAVVVYLRKIYYPAGFSFPLNVISPQILTIEMLREISTIAILFTVAWLSGRNFYEQLASFLYIFGIWDIFYYIFLKVFLNWPASLLTWDILFLIPVTWIGPVLAPLICSITMLFMALLITYLQRKSDVNPAFACKSGVKIKIIEWTFILSGIFIIFITFIYDFLEIILSGLSIVEFQNFVPFKYNWWAFCFGELLILGGLGIFYRRTTTSTK